MTLRTKKYIVLWLIATIAYVLLDMLIRSEVRPGEVFTRSWWLGMGFVYAWMMDRGWL